MRLASAIAALLLSLAVACGDGAQPAPSSSPSPVASPSPRLTRSPTSTASPPHVVTSSPTPAPTASPTPAPTPSAPSVDVSGSQTRQGGFLVVRLLNPPSGLSSAAAFFAGAAYPMLPEEDRWFAVIGLPTWLTVGGYPLEVSGPGGTLATGWITVSEGGFQFESVELPPETGDLLLDTARIEEERVRVEQIVSAFTPERYWSGAWLVPAQGVVTNPFGLQRSINGGPYFPHSGTDIAADLGTPVHAAAAGVVALADELFLYGNSIIIDHGAGVFSGYGHLDRLAVAAGQWVNKGDLIGYMGTTGLSSGPHLHWEAIVHGVRVDPMLWARAGVEP